VIQTVLSESFKGLNDLTLHADESILFTDQGQTGLQDPPDACTGCTRTGGWTA